MTRLLPRLARVVRKAFSPVQVSMPGRRIRPVLEVLEDRLALSGFGIDTSLNAGKMPPLDLGAASAPQPQVNFFAFSGHVALQETDPQHPTGIALQPPSALQAQFSAVTNLQANFDSSWAANHDDVKAQIDQSLGGEPVYQKNVTLGWQGQLLVNIDTANQQVGLEYVIPSNQITLRHRTDGPFPQGDDPTITINFTIEARTWVPLNPAPGQDGALHASPLAITVTQTSWSAYSPNRFVDAFINLGLTQNPPLADGQTFPGLHLQGVQNDLQGQLDTLNGALAQVENAGFHYVGVSLNNDLVVRLAKNAPYNNTLVQSVTNPYPPYLRSGEGIGSHIIHSSTGPVPLLPSHNNVSASPGSSLGVAFGSHYHVTTNHRWDDLFGSYIG